MRRIGGYLPVTAPEPIGPTDAITDTTPRFRWTAAQDGTSYELIVTRSSGVEEFRKTYPTTICENGVCEVTSGRTWDLDTYNWQVRVYTDSGSTLGPLATFTIN